MSATLLGAGWVCGGALTIASRQMPLDSLFGDLLRARPLPGISLSNPFYNKYRKAKKDSLKIFAARSKVASETSSPGSTGRRREAMH